MKIKHLLSFLVLVFLDIGVLITLFVLGLLESSACEYPTTGIIRVQNQSGIMYEYQGEYIEISEEDGKVLVLVDLPYSGDTCITPKFQDRMSMDWDADEETLMLEFAEYLSPSGSAEVKAWNILVVLNRMLDENHPNSISGVIEQELEQRGESLEFLDSVVITQVDRAAMDLIKQKRWDVTDGSLVFQE